VPRPIAKRTAGMFSRLRTARSSLLVIRLLIFHHKSSAIEILDLRPVARNDDDRDLIGQ